MSSTAPFPVMVSPQKAHSNGFASFMDPYVVLCFDDMTFYQQVESLFTICAAKLTDTHGLQALPVCHFCPYLLPTPITVLHFSFHYASSL